MPSSPEHYSPKKKSLTTGQTTLVLTLTTGIVLMGVAAVLDIKNRVGKKEPAMVRTGDPRVQKKETLNVQQQLPDFPNKEKFDIRSVEIIQRKPSINPEQPNIVFIDYSLLITFNTKGFPSEEAVNAVLHALTQQDSVAWLERSTGDVVSDVTSSPAIAPLVYFHALGLHEQYKHSSSTLVFSLHCKKR
jgi:hypothetical protein